MRDRNEKFVVGIPSYRRPNAQESAMLMHRLGIERSRLYIFVQTDEDFGLYQKNYGHIAQIVLKCANGVSQARNNILRELLRTNNILMLDDDISAIGVLSGDKLREITDGNEFHNRVGKYFEFARKANAKLFGVYPVYNDFFMSNTVSTKVTVNTLIGFVKDSGLLFDESLKAKEDIDMCARVLNGGGCVIRFNNVAIKAKHRTNDGGCKEIWKSSENEAVSRLLEKRYPKILKVRKRNTSEVDVVVKDVKMRLK